MRGHHRRYEDARDHQSGHDNDQDSRTSVHDRCAHFQHLLQSPGMRPDMNATAVDYTYTLIRLLRTRSFIRGPIRARQTRRELPSKAALLRHDKDGLPELISGEPRTPPADWGTRPGLPPRGPTTKCDMGDLPGPVGSAGPDVRRTRMVSVLRRGTRVEGMLAHPGRPFRIQFGNLVKAGGRAHREARPALGRARTP